MPLKIIEEADQHDPACTNKLKKNIYPGNFKIFAIPRNLTQTMNKPIKKPFDIELFVFNLYFVWFKG